VNSNASSIASARTRGHRRRELAGPLGERRRRGVEAAEHHRAERRGPHRDEADLREVEARELVALRDADQPAVGPVAPRVIGAAELPAAVALPLGERRAAVPARVQEAAHLAVVATHGHDRRRADRGGDEVTRPAEPGRSATCTQLRAKMRSISAAYTAGEVNARGGSTRPGAGGARSIPSMTVPWLHASPPSSRARRRRAVCARCSSRSRRSSAASGAAACDAEEHQARAEQRRGTELLVVDARRRPTGSWWRCSARRPRRDRLGIDEVGDLARRLRLASASAIMAT
jgi:hypothetical protein